MSGSSLRRPSRPASATASRIVDEALAAFAARGYEATSLDALAASLGMRKQSILYWYPSKDALLDAAVDRCASELALAMEEALARAGEGWARIEAVVKAVFRLAARRPEILGLVREAGRIGAPASGRLMVKMEPLVRRASGFLEAEMEAGRIRRHDPQLLLLAIYSTVIGMVTEVELLQALGEEPTARSLVRRRAEILRLLRGALLADG
jgi:TetR/AcrR family transcriptional regulator